MSRDQEDIHEIVQGLNNRAPPSVPERSGDVARALAAYMDALQPLRSFALHQGVLEMTGPTSNDAKSHS